MDRATQPLSAHELSHDPELADWRVILGKLQSRFVTGKGGFNLGAQFASRIAEKADELDHHPDVDLRYPHVTVTTVSHDVGALTDRDRQLATAISGIAAELGLKARPGKVSSVEIALDVMSASAVAPFWQAVLGYQVEGPKGAEIGEPTDDGYVSTLVDPAGRNAPLWFQQMEEPRTERNRFHLDITVPHDVAEERLAAALEAGGTLVTDEFAPAWIVLADPEGNEVCICTWQGRDQDADG